MSERKRVNPGDVPRTLTCEKIVRMVSGGEALSSKEKLVLKLHLTLCRYLCQSCALYGDQMKALREGAMKASEEVNSAGEEEISELVRKSLEIVKRK